jgi:nucleotide-binding universal stress UspA family protein
MYTNILIPTDGSELAGKAVQNGVALAKRIDAKTTVLTVLPPFHLFTTDTQMLEDTPIVEPRRGLIGCVHHVCSLPQGRKQTIGLAAIRSCYDVRAL